MNATAFVSAVGDPGFGGACIRNFEASAQGRRMVSFEPVRAVLRALDVLQILNEEGPSPASTVAAVAALPLPTAIRLLETLMAAGYVYKDAQTNCYGVTARTLALSRGYDSNSRLVQIAKPVIEDLRAAIGWPSSLAVYVESDNAMSTVYTNRDTYGISMPGRLGARLPLRVTSVGTMFLASLTEDRRQGILARLPNSASRWDTDPQFARDLQSRIESAQASGYALADQRYLDTVYDSKIWAVAVPVIVQGRTACVLSTLVLRNPSPQRRLLTQIGPALMQASADIASRLAADAGPAPKARKARAAKISG